MEQMDVASQGKEPPLKTTDTFKKSGKQRYFDLLSQQYNLTVSNRNAT